jgi:hypothetical protein
MTKNTELNTMNRLLSEMQNHASSWPFREPVKPEDAADYREVIEQPMGPSSFTFVQKLVHFTKAEKTLLSSSCRFKNHGGEAREWRVRKLGAICRRRPTDLRQLSVLQRRGLNMVQAREPT